MNRSYLIEEKYSCVKREFYYIINNVLVTSKNLLFVWLRSYILTFKYAKMIINQSLIEKNFVFYMIDLQKKT